MKINLLLCFQNLHGSRHIDLSVAKCLQNVWNIALKEFMFYFKYTKTNSVKSIFQYFCLDNYLPFTICSNFKNTYFTELFATGFCWLPVFSNKINATLYSIVKRYSIVNQNIMKIKIKFKINHASMNDYNYGKSQLSLNVISL